MTEEEERYLAYRVRVLPSQLEAARRKVNALECEARRYGMLDLLPSAEEVNAAWAAEIENAYIDGTKRAEAA